jgi:antitoxin component of MazEF toxin-antitoxin module
MSITTTQKIIKIGTSRGVTLPAKELKRLGVDVGDDVKITLEPVESQDDLMRDYEAFKKQYAQTLKGLSGHDKEVIKTAQKLLKRHEQAFRNLAKE